MRVVSLTPLLSLACFFSLSSAGRVPFGSLASGTSSSANSDHPVSVARAQDATGFHYSHAANDEYTATIYVNGAPYQVILDTGSSDTWIDPLSQGVSEPSDLFHTGFNSSTTYVDGSVSSGPIVLADVTFGAYTVKNQAITIAYNASTQPTLFNGLIGLGGALKSQIAQILANSSFAENGNPIIYNLFDHEPDLPNYTTFLMSRSEIGITDGGVLTVSEVLSNMTDILNAPLYQSPLPSQWTTVMDGMYVNGEFLNGFSNFSTIYRELNATVPDGSTIATFDTGTSYVQGPPEYTKAIYSRVPGAKPLPPDSGLGSPNMLFYSVPCNTKLNITWSFSGNLYPMHPVDAIDIIFDSTNGTFFCVGTIFGGPNPNEAHSHMPCPDFLLGASFLRNAYQLYDYGTMDALRSKPAARLLSITDADKAWAEADALNLARVLGFENDYQSSLSATATAAATALPDFTGSAAPASLTSVDDPFSASGASAAAWPSGSAISEADARIAGALSEDGDSSADPLNLSTLTRNSYIILGLLAGVLIMLIVVIALVVKANRANKGYRAVPNTGFPVAGKVFEADSEAYSTPYNDRP
ncbi:aspartic peptidase domain-containing protein [Cubamyces menziesii]|nr:aspartic peptidase domain-containing protein [Cubamyces menziesii]